ncbi:MAG: hypothetical protein DRJ28_02990 [Actinobacteria bacterium]|nr:MAG: hypothetical protein DRJ28_02990 [Actinomycetota bacterium]
MFFWHIGATIAFVRYAFRDEAMDLRFLAAGALLPNLIDTPIGALMWTSWQAPRLWSHSLIFGSALMVVVLLATTRGQRRKQWMLLAIGVLMHLALDAMWADPGTLWWPFFGLEFTRSEFSMFGEYASAVMRDPWMWSGELLGVLYLSLLWQSSGLNRRDARSQLLSTGRVSAPIGRN